MILSFGNKETERFSSGLRVKAFEGFERAARLKLDRLLVAPALSDLAALPGNRFETLRGDREEQYSIRVNEQWRICFSWDKDFQGFANVEIVDYH